jgi:hypothetical protein
MPLCQFCGTQGAYQRKTKSPEWRCRNCKKEWDGKADSYGQKPEHGMPPAPLVKRPIDYDRLLFGHNKKSSLESLYNAWQFRTCGLYRPILCVLSGGIWVITVKGAWNWEEKYTDRTCSIEWRYTYVVDDSTGRVTQN